MQEVKNSSPPPQEGGRGRGERERGRGRRGRERGVTGSWQWDLRQNRVFEEGGGGGKGGVEETAEEVAARYLAQTSVPLVIGRFDVCRSLLTFVGLF
jgi:hypothetical protein